MEKSGKSPESGFDNQTSFPRGIARGHCVPPSERGSARALALRGRTCAPPLRRSLGRKVFRATLCVSHSRRRRSPSIPNLTINSATWRLSTPRSLPELIHTRAKCIISVSSVSCAQLCEKQGMLTSTSSSRRAATKSTAKALSLCGARCRGVWRSCAPERAPRCAAWRWLWGGIVPLGESREPPQASRACTVKRARERARRLVHRRRFWRTATRARERVAKRCRV